MDKDTPTRDGRRAAACVTLWWGEPDGTPWRKLYAGRAATLPCAMYTQQSNGQWRCIIAGGQLWHESSERAAAFYCETHARAWLAAVLSEPKP